MDVGKFRYLSLITVFGRVGNRIRIGRRDVDGICGAVVVIL